MTSVTLNKRKRSEESVAGAIVHKKKKTDQGHESVPFLVDDVIVEILTFLDSNNSISHFKRLMQMRRVSKVMQKLVFRAMNAIRLMHCLLPQLANGHLTFKNACYDVNIIDAWCECFVTTFMHFGISVLDEEHDAWWRRSFYPVILIVGWKQLMTCWKLQLNEDDSAAQFKEVLDDTDSGNVSRLLEAIRLRERNEIQLALREYFFRILFQFRNRFYPPKLYVISLRPDGPDPKTQAFFSMYQIAPSSNDYSLELGNNCIARQFQPTHETITAVFEKMETMSPFDYCHMKNSDYYDTILYNRH